MHPLDRLKISLGVDHTVNATWSTEPWRFSAFRGGALRSGKVTAEGRQRPPRRAEASIRRPIWRGTATAFSITTAHAAGASSSMSPEQSSAPLSPVVGRSPSTVSAPPGLDLARRRRLGGSAALQSREASAERPGIADGHPDFHLAGGEDGNRHFAWRPRRAARSTRTRGRGCPAQAPN